MCIQLTSSSLRKSQRRTRPTNRYIAVQFKILPNIYTTTPITMSIDIQLSTHLKHPQQPYHLMITTSTSIIMPALPRPETDYERWMRDRKPDIQISEKPQYGLDPVVEYPSSMKHVSDPQLLLEDQRSPPHTPNEHRPTGKSKLLADYPRDEEAIVDLITALVVLGILFFTIWVVKARRRPVPRILGRVSIREKRNV
ncbi:hypothetical protein BDV27DRAFT_124503 [Aspergillus caelatus]|uniref:Uncharacterized protein n=1 Tax=Aspergillus caelatus TaxID=61420 RepID=A0A5N7ACN8_9EURO|nr:uncharacterized protein BDV27DRAFT_124503 [Aspergillus caelatus]KAE8367108.1 hypothetical protein BDV27DRAFT_124503 [Aspergillus caelatus]